jgi:hypothetical protein
MALVLADRVQETSTTTGTGTLTLAGAVAGFQSFSVIGNANTTYYCITEASTGAWEVGTGTYTSSGTTLSRTSVYSSSNANTLVNFTSGALTVFCSYPASRSVIQATFDSPPPLGSTTPGYVYCARGASAQIPYFSGSKEIFSDVNFKYNSYGLVSLANGTATFSNFTSQTLPAIVTAAVTGGTNTGRNVTYVGTGYGSLNNSTSRFSYNVYYDNSTNSADTYDQTDSVGAIDFYNGSGSSATWYFKIANSGTAGNVVGWYTPLYLTTAGAWVSGTLTANNFIKSNNSSAGIGYATNAGSTITQLTSKSTAVTLNTICGQITTNSAALAASTSVSFTLTNSSIAATDVVIVNAANVGGSAPTINTYQVSVDSVLAGSCRIHIRNVSAASASQAIVLNFAVIKSVAA